MPDAASPKAFPQLTTLAGLPSRPVRLFRNGANQAVRVPKDFEPPGKDAVMFRDANRIIIEAAFVNPHPKGSPAAILAGLARLRGMPPMNEPFPDVNDDDLPPLDDIDLDKDWPKQRP